MMDFFKYRERLTNTLKITKENTLNQVFEVFDYIIKNQGTVIFCGNGGSFANSLHIAGDYHKTFAKQNASFHAVGENFCSISAIANDNCFEDAISISINPLIKKQIPTCIVFLSGSGNSINLVNALNLIKNDIKNAIYLKTVSLSAFGGGEISKLADIVLSYDLDDMEIAEDIQLIIFHYLKQKLLERYPDKIENYLKYNKRIMNGDIA